METAVKQVGSGSPVLARSHEREQRTFLPVTSSLPPLLIPSLLPALVPPVSPLPSPGLSSCPCHDALLQNAGDKASHSSSSPSSAKDLANVHEFDKLPDERHIVSGELGVDCESTCTAASMKCQVGLDGKGDL
eukprot:747132-Hanusia_phi.AAC.1